MRAPTPVAGPPTISCPTPTRIRARSAFTQIRPGIFGLFLLVTSACDSSNGISGVGADDAVDLSTARLTLVSGDDQKGIVGETAPNALSVQVVDAAGAAIGGATVDWIFAQGKGRGSAISPNAERVSTTTDQQGNSSVQWTFGPTAGTQQALAELSTNLPMTVGASTAPPQHNGRRVGFTSQVRASHPASVTVEPSSVRIESGDQITLKATVTDKFGNILENVSVDWS